MIEEMKGLDQRKHQVAIKDFFLFGSWFASKRSDEAVKYRGDDSICMVKTYTKGYYKEATKNMMKY